MQPAPDLLGGLDAIGGIPAPAPILIQPRLFAMFRALVTAATLTTLYLYRGRPFIVYWIGSWLLFAGSLALLARGYADARLGSVMAGLAQLLAVWSAGLLMLAGRSFPLGRVRWTASVRIAAATDVWFLAAPFALPLTVVVTSGLAATASLLGWAGVRNLALVRRTPHVGVAVIGAIRTADARMYRGKLGGSAEA